MSDRYDNVISSVLALTLKDVVDGDQLLSFSQIKDKLAQLEREYNKSEYIENFQKKLNAQYEKANTLRLLREEKRADWCKQYLRVGDIVKVTGTSTGKYRKIMELNPEGFTNVQFDLATGKVRPIYTTITSYGKVTRILNPLTGLMEKLSMEDKDW